MAKKKQDHGAGRNRNDERKRTESKVEDFGYSGVSDEYDTEVDDMIGAEVSALDDDSEFGELQGELREGPFHGFQQQIRRDRIESRNYQTQREHEPQNGRRERRKRSWEDDR